MRGLPFFKPKNKPQFAGLNFSETSSGGGGGGGGGGHSIPDFSTDETDTGVKWIDGKNIYRKVIHIILYQSVTPYPHNIVDLDNIINVFGFTKRNNGEIFMFNNTTSSSSDELGIININATNFSTFAGSGAVAGDGQDAYITFYYTKATS